jgi:hypothetical protein
MLWHLSAEQGNHAREETIEAPANRGDLGPTIRPEVQAGLIDRKPGDTVIAFVYQCPQRCVQHDTSVMPKHRFGDRVVTH